MGKIRTPGLRYRIVDYATVGICSVSQSGVLYTLDISFMAGLEL